MLGYCGNSNYNIGLSALNNLPNVDLGYQRGIGLRLSNGGSSDGALDEAPIESFDQKSELIRRAEAGLGPKLEVFVLADFNIYFPL